MLAFNAELNDVRQMYAEGHLEPPGHANMPPVVSKLMWVHALKERIKVREKQQIEMVENVIKLVSTYLSSEINIHIGTVIHIVKRVVIKCNKLRCVLPTGKIQVSVVDYDR